MGIGGVRDDKPKTNQTEEAMKRFKEAREGATEETSDEYDPTAIPPITEGERKYMEVTEQDRRPEPSVPKKVVVAPRHEMPPPNFNGKIPFDDKAEKKQVGSRFYLTPMESFTINRFHTEPFKSIGATRNFDEARAIAKELHTVFAEVDFGGKKLYIVLVSREEGQRLDKYMSDVVRGAAFGTKCEVYYPEG